MQGLLVNCVQVNQEESVIPDFYEGTFRLMNGLNGNSRCTHTHTHLGAVECLVSGEFVEESDSHHFMKHSTFRFNT